MWIARLGVVGRAWANGIAGSPLFNPAVRAKLAVAAKARWAEVKAEGKNTL